MQASASKTREHQVVFCGLEVLRLIGERMENRNHVDQDDLLAVLSFVRDVAHRCLDNTETLFGDIATHRQARALFEELTHTANASAADDFGSAARAYTTLMADLIFQERHSLPSVDLTTFHLREVEVDELAGPHGQTLHRLELKYTSPHCI